MQSMLGKIRDRLLPPATPPVQILSDLHLEVGQQYRTYTFPVMAPLLLLAGDIGNLTNDEGISKIPRVFLWIWGWQFKGT